MSIENDVTTLMKLVEEYGEMREWHGARPGDDETGELEVSEGKVREAIRNRLALEIGTLIPAISQIEAGDTAGALRMLRRRAELVAGITPSAYLLTHTSRA